MKKETTEERVFKVLFGEKEEKKLNRPLTTEERVNKALWGEKEEPNLDTTAGRISKYLNEERKKEEKQVAAAKDEDIRKRVKKIFDKHL